MKARVISSRNDSVEPTVAIVLLKTHCADGPHLLSALVGSEVELHAVSDPIPMLLWCPECHQRHVDEGLFAQKEHHTHACQLCGHVWRPALAPTVGVRFLPGFKDLPTNGE